MIYNHIVPAGSFVANYMEHMHEQETAVAYDFWCAMWLLSVACGRNVFVDRPRAPVFLNLYAILVAESGVTRKSSAVRLASKLARQLISTSPFIGIVESSVTAARVEDLLHMRSLAVGSGQLIIATSELAATMGSMATASMAPLLTDLYDCPAVRRGGGTIARGSVEHLNVWVSFISASTPTWLFRSVNPNIIEGGFTSRCFFIISDKPKARIPWPMSDSDDTSHFLTELQSVRDEAIKYGSVTLNDNALATFSTWYVKRKLNVDTFRSSFESREDAHVLRIAALLCVNDNTWVVQHQHIMEAIKLVADLKLSAYRLFSGNHQRSKWLLGIESVRDTLLSAGKEAVPRSKLFLKCRKHLDNQEFVALMDTMHESGFVTVMESQHEHAGRIGLLYKGTNLLRARGVIDQLADLTN